MNDTTNPEARSSEEMPEWFRVWRDAEFKPLTERVERQEHAINVIILMGFPLFGWAFGGPLGAAAGLSIISLLLLVAHVVVTIAKRRKASRERAAAFEAQLDELMAEEQALLDERRAHLARLAESPGTIGEVARDHLSVHDAAHGTSSSEAR